MLVTSFVLISLLTSSPFKKVLCCSSKLIFNVLASSIIFFVSNNLILFLNVARATQRYVAPLSIYIKLSFSATILGLNIGDFLNIKYGKISTMIGGIILFILGISYIL